MSKPSTAAAASLQWFGWTEVGKVRPHNEDSFVGLRFDAREVQRLGKFGDGSVQHHDFAFAVCDGMGGAKAGEYASKIAVEKITTLLPRSFQQKASGLESGFSDVLTELFTQIHKALSYLGQSYDECHGMETTMSLGWFTPGWMYFGHVGDSRIYYYCARDGSLKQLTHDDTYVGWMFRNGQINEREARTHPRRNVLQKTLGGSSQFVDPQVGAVGCEPGDRFLLCSDGLTDGLYDHYLLDVLRAAPGTDNPAQRLVLDSVAASGKDNTTAMVIQVG